MDLEKGGPMSYKHNMLCYCGYFWHKTLFLACCSKKKIKQKTNKKNKKTETKKRKKKQKKQRLVMLLM